MAKSSKASAIFTGEDSFGRSVEVAIRSDDQQAFSRRYENNGYGKAFSKWSAVPSDQPITHPTTFTILTDGPHYGDKVQIPEADQHMTIDWGFGTLSLCEDGHTRLRLPLVA